jgi:hypothetical protein
MRERAVAALFALPLIALGAGCAPTRGNGEPAVQRRTFDAAFDGVRVSDGLVVELSPSPDDNGAVWVESDSNLVPLIHSEVRDGVLEIFSDDIEPTVPTAVRVTLKTLASASGADEGTTILATGIDRRGEGAQLTLNLSEGAAADLSGGCDRLVAIVTGASTLRASDLECLDAQLDVMERSLVEARVTGEVVLRAASESTVRLTGRPAVDETVSDDVTVEVEAR